MWNMDTQREEVCIPFMTATKIKAVMSQSAQTWFNTRFGVYSFICYMPLIFRVFIVLVFNSSFSHRWDCKNANNNLTLNLNRLVVQVVSVLS